MRTLRILGFSIAALATNGCAITPSSQPAPTAQPVEARADQPPEELASPAPRPPGLFVRAEPHGAVPKPSSAAAATPLELDACDEPDFAGVAWKTATYGDYVLRYLPGTAAERDLAAIVSVRVNLQAKMQKVLGVTDVGPITLVLSPNRVAAAHAGYAAGSANAAKNQIEVLYLGLPDAYENQAPGHEVAHIVTSKIDGLKKLPLLTEGIAEYFDGSGRDLHASYVNALRAGIDTDYTTRFTDFDVNAYNYARAGSFVKFLIERYGASQFVALWKASTVTSSWPPKLASGGDGITTGRDLEKAFDTLSRKVYGVGFETLRSEWLAALKPYLAAPVEGLAPADYAAIENVIANADSAQSKGDASALRTTMEGFYCDFESDLVRADRSRNVTEARGTMTTNIVSAWPTNRRNFPTAVVHALRSERRGDVVTTTTAQFWLERFPMGWRITWISGW